MARWDWHCNFSDLVGKTLIEIRKDLQRNDDYLIFITDHNERYKLYHEQDCCESVDLDDIAGDLDDLIGTPILYAEEISNSADASGKVQYAFLPTDARSSYDESHTWTFYKISTIKGSVTLRWYGYSNGYYSESVTFCRLPDEQEH